MKPGARTLGIAFSDGPSTSTVAGAVVRPDRATDGFAFSTCTVGGTDSTDAIVDLWERLDREDVQHLLVAGIAPAWFNLIDLHAVREATGRPTLAVSFEDSEGLEPALAEHFEGGEREERAGIYASLPPRREVVVDGESVYVRAVGLDDDEAADVVRAFSPGGGRPEPLRVARLLARAGREFREETGTAAAGTE